MNIEKPKQEIIFANVIMCLLVVFIHTSSIAVSSLEKSSIQYLAVMVPWRLSAFVVQGFIFLSALKIFIKKTAVTNYKRYYISRIKAIIVPYVIWVVVYYIYFCKHNYFPFSLAHLIKNMMLGSLVSPFYFIIIIVQFYALLPLWQWLYKRFNPMPILVISLLTTILCGQFLPKAINIITVGYIFDYNDRLLTTYILYWSMGAICGINYEKFSAWLIQKNIKITFTFALLVCIDIFLTFKVLVLGIFVSSLETIHIFYCVTAILFTMSIGIRTKPNSIFLAINSVSYPIYLAHCFVLFLINGKLIQYGIIDIGLCYAVRIFAVYTITILSCLIYRWLKNYLIHKKIMLK
jgi:Predicted acyltransferases